MNVGDTVTLQGLDGRTHAATVVTVHSDTVLDLRIGDREGAPLKRISRDDSATPHPFTWRPA